MFLSTMDVGFTLLISFEGVEEFALLEAEYTIVRFLQTFRNVEMATEEEKTVDHPDHTLTLVLASAKGCKVKLTV